MLLLELRVRFVPPTASAQPELAGHETCGFFSEEVSWLAGTPRAHADEPVSPAATTTVIPSAASAASCRVTRVRDAEYADTVDSHTPYDTDTTLGSGAPLLVAWMGAASILRKPSTSPSSAFSLIGCTQRSKRSSCGATIDTTIASSELSSIGCMPETMWIFRAVPCNPKQLRYWFTSEVGVGPSPTIASRTP